PGTPLLPYTTLFRSTQALDHDERRRPKPQHHAALGRAVEQLEATAAVAAECLGRRRVHARLGPALHVHRGDPLLAARAADEVGEDRKSTRLNSSHVK